MNTRNITILSLALLVLGAVAAFGQDVYGVRATVPFEFTVDNETYPAGQYTVSFAAYQNSRLALLVGADGKSLQLVGTISCEPKGRGVQPHLMFRRYGNQNFLAEVSTSSMRRAITMSRAEREIAKSAAAKADVKQIMVAAN